MNDELRALVSSRIRHAEESLEDARCLLSLDRGARTAVNRSYFAVFYCVLALLQTKGKIPRKHAGALSLFDKEFIKSGLLPKELSEVLHTLFEKRLDDDYRRIDEIDLEEASESLEQAGRFLDSAKDYLKRIGLF